MVDVARVLLFGRSVGTVRWDERYEVAQFEYEKSFYTFPICPLKGRESSWHNL